MICLIKSSAVTERNFRINSKTTPELFDDINDDPGYLWNLLKTLDNEYRVITVKKERRRSGPRSL